MSTPIADGQTQYLVYQNSFLRGICKSKDSVLVTWSTGFAQSVTAQTWDNREFLEQPERARVVGAEQEEQARAFFAQSSNRRLGR